MLRDFVFAARRLAATPLFLAFAVLSLAIGVALTVTSYAVVESVFWRPLGIRQADRVVVVSGTPSRPGSPGQPALISRADFEQITAGQTTFSSVAATTSLWATLAAPSRTDTVTVAAVTSRFFAALGVDAAGGRTIDPSDASASSAVIVLSDRAWRRRFAAAPDIVGRIVRLGSHPFQVIGVAPPDFTGLERYRTVEAWIPLEAIPLLPGTAARIRDDYEQLAVIGRIVENRSVEQASAAMRLLGRNLDASAPVASVDGGPPRSPRDWRVRPVEAVDRTVTDLLPVALIALVLLVACTNLANLVLARGAVRRHELAVRRALGASRWRLVREQCAESLIIALLGGAATITLTRALLSLIPAALPVFGMQMPFDPQLSASALLVAAGALVIALLTFGVEPALQLTRAGLAPHLAAEAGAAPQTRRQWTLLRWQVAISTCFFLVAVILGRVVVDAAARDTGVDLEDLAVLTVVDTTSRDEERRRGLVDDIVAAARQSPGVQSAAASVGLPFGNSDNAIVTAADGPFSAGRRYAGVYSVALMPEMFGTLGIPIVAGRGFEVRDDAASPLVTVLSESTARMLFGTPAAVGRLLNVHTPTGESFVTTTIVGIARDTDTGSFGSRERGIVYRPLSQHFGSRITLVARTSGSVATTVRILQEAVRAVDPDLGIQQAGPAETVLAGFYPLARLVAGVTASLGLLTLFLAAVGLYGVQSQVVAHRTREVGVRLAVGASARQIRRMVLADGFRPVVQGLLLGLLLGTLTRLVLRTQLDAPIALVDTTALLIVPVPLLVAAALACLVPASRAAHVDPIVALRHLG